MALIFVPLKPLNDIWKKILPKSNIAKMIKMIFWLLLLQELACSGLIGTNCGPETNELCTPVLDGSQRKQICRPCLYVDSLIKKANVIRVGEV